MLFTEFQHFAGMMEAEFWDDTMQYVLSKEKFVSVADPHRLEVSENEALLEWVTIPACLTMRKEDGNLQSVVMHPPPLTQPFELNVLARYAIVFGWPGLDNVFTGLAFNLAYQIHYQTLFGYALAWAVCVSGVGCPTVVC